MNRRRLPATPWTLLTALLLAGAQPAQSQPAQAEPAQTRTPPTRAPQTRPAADDAAAGPDDWQALCDGRTLAGWTRRGGAARFRVEGGEIIGTSVPDTPNSFLCTDRELADFILECEFKVDPRLNSGIQIRSASAPGYADGRVHGYQVEIDPSERGWTAGIYDEGRRGWLADLKDNPAARAAFRPGAWNHLRIEARGQRLKTWLNGVPAADLNDDLTHSGFIALQVHRTEIAEPLEVRWRNLRIRDLGDPWRTPPPGALRLLGPDGDLSAWTHAGRPGSRCEWTWTDGALEIRPGTGSLVTQRAFGDCRLHVEFCVDDNAQAGQANGNSGIYLQGRYEIQILNSAGQPPADNICGAIYKVKAPDYNLARPAGQWQTCDIAFQAARWDSAGRKTAPARVTVYHNGTRIHDDVAIPAQTGAGQPESPADGPLLLQDHGNRVRFRNIWLLPLPGAPPPG